MLEHSKNKIDASTELRQRIDEALHTRRARRGTASAKVESIVKTAGAKVWRELKRHPSAGMVAVGGAGLAAASFIGVGELTIGIVMAYAAYQVLREGVAPMTAAEDIIKDLR